MSSEEFDPYRKWLGIPPHEQPPNHYRLLGIALFEEDADVIQNAADRQMAHIRTFKMSRYSAESQKLLNELSEAKVCLLTPDDKFEYDAHLHVELAPPTRPAETRAVPPPVPVGVVPPAVPAAPPPAPPAAPPAAAPPAVVAVPNIGRPVAPLPTGVPVAAAEPASAAVPVIGRIGSSLGASLAAASAPVAVLPGRPVPVAPAPVVEGAPDVGPVVRSGSPAARGKGGDRESSATWMIVLGVGGGVLAIAGLVFALNQSSTPAHNPKPPVNPPSAANPKPRPVTPAVPKPGEGANKKPGGEDFVSNDPILWTPRPGSGDSSLDEALRRVRESLKDRNLHAAREQLDKARASAKDEPAKKQIEHWDAILERLDRFWAGVRKGTFARQEDLPVKFFEPDRERDREYELIRSQEDLVTYRANGQEKTEPVMKLPSRDAIAFFHRGSGLRKGPPLTSEELAWNKVYVAAFLVFETQGNDRDLERRRGRAKELWLDAAKSDLRDPYVARELGLQREIRPGAAPPVPPPEATAALPSVGPEVPRPMPRPMPEPMPTPRPMRPAPPPIAEGGLPVPTGAELKEAQSRLQAKHQELTKLRDSNARAVLAAKLVQAALKDDLDPADRYVTFEKAWQLAAEAGRVEPALLIVEAAAEQFVIDQPAEKLACLEKAFGSPPISGETATEISTAAGAIYEPLLAARRYDLAEEAARLSGRGAKLAGDAAGDVRGRKQGDWVHDLGFEQKSFDKNSKGLEANPADASLNHLVGRFTCWGLEEWDIGLPLLTKGSDPELRGLATAELAKPTDAAEMLRIGSGWFAVAKRRKQLSGQHITKHALSWLEKAEAGAEGATRDEAAAKVKEAKDFLRSQG